MNLSTALHGGFSLRPMTAEDVEAVAIIEAQAQPTPWSEAVFHDCLRGGYQCAVMVTRDNMLAGFIIISTVLDEAHLLNIVVDRAFQRRGLAWATLQHVITLLPSADMSKFYLEVRASNTGAQALYEKLGFDMSGRRKDYYRCDQGREDAILMTKVIDVEHR